MEGVMAVGAQAVQRIEAVAFSVVVARAEGVFEYEIRDAALGVKVPEIAEVLFSIALDMQAKERAAIRA
jgi:hypothetical protein